MEDTFSVAYQKTENGKELDYAFFGIFDGWVEENRNFIDKAMTLTDVIP